MHDDDVRIGDALKRRGVSRRDFMRFAGTMAAVLALPRIEGETIAHALETAPRLPVIWLEFQDCTGDTESFLRASARRDPLIPSVTDPSVTDILLDVLSVDYHETIMAPSGMAKTRSTIGASTMSTTTDRCADRLVPATPCALAIDTEENTV